MEVCRQILDGLYMITQYVDTKLVELKRMGEVVWSDQPDHLHSLEELNKILMRERTKDFLNEGSD